MRVVVLMDYHRLDGSIADVGETYDEPATFAGELIGANKVRPEDPDDLIPGGGGVPDQPVRTAVKWVTTGAENFTSGTIDVSGAPFNGAGNVEVGDAILAASPSQESDSGIWEVTAVNAEDDEATVVRRADSATGTVFYAGETVYDYTNLHLYLLEVITNDGTDVASAELDDEGVVGLYWVRVPGITAELNGLNVTGVTALEGSSIIREVDYFAVAQHYGTHADTGISQGYNFISAAGGNVSVQLDSAAQVMDAGRTFQTTVKRTDSSGNTFTITVSSGQFLEGVEDGTLTLSALESATFACDGVSKWWRVA